MKVLKLTKTLLKTWIQKSVYLFLRNFYINDCGSKIFESLDYYEKTIAIIKIYQTQNFQPSQTKKNLPGKIFPLKIEHDARNSCNLQNLTMTFFETKYRKPYSLWSNLLLKCWDKPFKSLIEKFTVWFEN